MGKVLSRFIRDGGNGYLMHWCPGCKSLHLYMVNSGEPGRNWSYNGNHEKPSFSPSMLINQGQPGKTCHYFLTDGMLQYCSDTDAHGIKGTVPLPELPEWLQQEEIYAHTQEDHEDQVYYNGLGPEDRAFVEAYKEKHWRNAERYKPWKEWMRLAQEERDTWVDSTHGKGL